MKIGKYKNAHNSSRKKKENGPFDIDEDRLEKRRKKSPKKNDQTSIVHLDDSSQLS